MSFSDKLTLLLDEYLIEVDKRNILRISIPLPKHNGNFWITDSSFHLLNNSAEFSLAIFFSFSHNDKEGKRILKKINETESFSDFIKQHDGKKVTGYIKPFGTNKKTIVDAIINITKELFPAVIIDNIIPDLVRAKWHTIGKLQ